MNYLSIVFDKMINMAKPEVKRLKSKTETASNEFGFSIRVSHL